MENAHEQPAGEAITRVFHVQGTVRAEELGEMLALMPIGVLVLEGDAGRVIMANQVAIDLSGRDVVGSVAEERRAWLKRVAEQPGHIRITD